MRILRRSLFLIGAACTLVASLFGQTVRVLSVSGEATIQMPGEAAPRVVRKGDTIVVGTRIVTAEGARVIITPLPGVNSIIAPKSDVVIERVSETRDPGAAGTLHTAVLDLRTGAVTTDLQKREGVELDYGVRTARGLAGARGTTYTIGVNEAGVQTVVVADGVITLTLTDGRVISLVPGQVSITRPDGTSQSVASAAELSEGDQMIADNWVETTLDSLAEAVEQGIEVDAAALEDAIRSARDLGIDVDEDTQAKLERARQRQLERQERRERSGEETLQEKLEQSGGGGDDDLGSGDDDVNTQEQSSGGTSSAFDFAAFIATFSPDVQSQFFALGTGQRQSLAAYIGRLQSSSDRGAVLLFALSLPATDVLPAYLGRSDSIKTYLAKHPSDTDLANFALYPYGESSVYPSDAVVSYYGKLNDNDRQTFASFTRQVQAAIEDSNDPQVREYAFELIEGEPRSSASMVFFLGLTTTQKGAFLDLSDSQQNQIMDRNSSALTAYALGASRTSEQVDFALGLDGEDQLPAFLALSSTVQARLVEENDSKLTDYVLSEPRSSAQMNFAFDLSSERRSVFFALPPDIQALLIAKAGDADLQEYALDRYGEGQQRGEADIRFFAGLTNVQRDQFLDLDLNDQERLISSEDPALKQYALAAGRTVDEASYAIGLESDRFTAFLTLDEAARDVLVDGAGDLALQNFAYGTGSTPRASATIVYFDDLNDNERTLYLARANDLQDAVARLDVADLEDLLFAEDTPGVFTYSDASLRHYLQLDDAVRPAFLASAPELREKFAEVNRPGLTGAILTPGTFETTPSKADLLRNLNALLALSPENRDFFETLAGGPAYPRLDTVPGPLDWSDAAWTRTRNSFESLPDVLQQRVVSMGASEGIFDYSGTFIEAAFADYESSLSTAARAAATSAGWGRDFASYFVKDEVRQIFAEAATFTTAELAAIKQFEISPEDFLVTQDEGTAAGASVPKITAPPSSLGAEAKANLAVLAGLSSEDRAVLHSLGLRGEILQVYGAPYYDENDNYVSPDFAQTLANAIDLADKFSSEELETLRDLGLGRALVGQRDGGEVFIGEASVEIRDFLGGLLEIFEGLTPDQQDAAIDTGAFYSINFNDYRYVDGTALTSALNTWLELDVKTRDFLAGEAGGDFNLMYLVEGNGFYRDLGDIDDLISSLDSDELGTLRDLDAGSFILNNNTYSEGLITPTELKAFLAYVGALTDPQVFAMRELGIVSRENHREGFFAADRDGLAHLLQVYAELDQPNADPVIGNVVVATRQIDPYKSYATYVGPSFFFADDNGADYVTYNVSFRSETSSLYVGAVRRLSLYGSHGESYTFAVPEGKDVNLRASSLIDLQSVSFSAGVRAIRMDAATINLAYTDIPAGAVVSLNSKLGGMGTGNRYPNFGSSLTGRVNFIAGVSYGGVDMIDEATFDSASRGNIAIGTLRNPASLPTYTPPPENNVD